MLSGGAGADSFVLDPSGYARILDFQQGTDTLEILAAEFGHGLTPGAAVDVVNAASPGSATHAGSNGYFIFDNAGGGAQNLYWDATGGSGRDAVLIGKLNGIGALSSADLHVI